MFSVQAICQLKLSVEICEVGADRMKLSWALRLIISQGDFASADKMGMMIPLYGDPGNALWSRIKNAATKLQLHVILNPNSGHIAGKSDPMN